MATSTACTHGTRDALGRLLVGCVLALPLQLAPGCFADGPIGMLPGGAFSSSDSETKPCPETGDRADRGDPGNWGRFADEVESELEVRPSRPRSVRTWNVIHRGELYVPADFLTPIKRWPYQVLEDPNVRIRIGGETFACRATRIEEPTLVEAVRESAGHKYQIDPSSRAARVEVWWFRLDPR